MWAWLSSVKPALAKLSVTAMLREQLALEKARSSHLEAEDKDLKAQLAVLQAKFDTEQANHNNTRNNLQELRGERAEEVAVWRTVESRQGKRTFGRWAAFCPKCHVPLSIGAFDVKCSANCGFSCDVKPSELRGALKSLEGEQA